MAKCGIIVADIQGNKEAIQSIGTIISERSAAVDDVGTVDRDLEDRIAALGLFPYEDWSYKHYPKELHLSCARGLGIWQYPNQLLPLASLLQRYTIESYLEIGIAAGGTFTFLCELLLQWSPCCFHAIGCDPAPPGCVSYLMENPYKEAFNAWLAATPSVEYVQEFSEKLERRFARDGHVGPRHFDCVFVDGDHSFEGCWADVQMALRFGAGIIILHDVVNGECPGVCEAWTEAQSTLKDDFEFFEFSAQYPCIEEKLGPMLGIGVCVRKTMPRRPAAM